MDYSALCGVQGLNVQRIAQPPKLIMRPALASRIGPRHTAPMRRIYKTRWPFALVFVLAVAGLSVAVAWQGYRAGMDQLAARGASDLALASDRLRNQLQRYREFAVMLAEDPLLATLQRPDLSQADRAAAAEEAAQHLLRVSDRTGARAVYYADAKGVVLAHSHGQTPTQLDQTAYFKRAMHGALGSAMGASTGSGLRSYSFAAPAFAADGSVRGALIVVVDLARLEREWRGASPSVLFTDAQGTVQITNRSELLFWQRGAGALTQDAQGMQKPVVVANVGPYQVWQQTWSPYVPGAALHLSKPLPVINMVGEAFLDVAPVRRLALLQGLAVAAICLFFGALLFLLSERRHVLAVANAELESRVADRTKEILEANTALRREITERQEAEAALQKAQADLVQAGKLSALGQLSAGISHELNQPLMALRSYAENAQTFLGKGRADRTRDNLDRISEMARRMARIIRNLRAFARNESEELRRVSLIEVIDAALELSGSRLSAMGVDVTWDRPNHPVWVRGGDVRLGQVFVNLINNAADAMENSEEKRLEIALDGLEAPGPLRVHIRDTGPGIEDPEKIFEPFYTTKAIGSGSGQEDGMGLGLSISYGLVESFGGSIKGANAADGGAVFTVALERWQESKGLEAAE